MMTKGAGTRKGGMRGATASACLPVLLLAAAFTALAALPVSGSGSAGAESGATESAGPVPAPGALTEAYIVTENTRRPIVPWSDPGAAGAASLQSHPTAYHWAAFRAVLDEPARQSLDALGVEVLGFAGRPDPYLLYKVRLADGAGSSARVYASLQGMPQFVNLLPILPGEKMNKSVRQGRFRHVLPGGKARATVFFHRQIDLAKAQALLAGKVDRVIAGPPAGCCHVEAAPARLVTLADLDEVARVEDYQEQLPLGPGKGAPAAR